MKIGSKSIRLGMLLWWGMCFFPSKGAALTCVTQFPGGSWSAAGTWSGCGGGAPGASDTATISSGHTVTVTGAVTVATVTVRGNLTFDRVASSTLTVNSGNITVKSGGTLDMGTTVSPVTGHATLILAKGSGATRYGLIVQNGGTFFSRGAAKSPGADAVTDAPAGAATVKVSVAQSSGWNAGDVIVLGQTEDGGSVNQTEVRTLSSLGAGDPRDVFWTGGVLSYDHIAANGFRVTNLTRNVVVISSGTDVNSTSAYVLNETADPLQFQAALTEFVGIGVNGGYQNAGVYMVDGNAIISSCTFRNGAVGFQAENAAGSVISDNVFYANANFAVVLAGGGGNTFSGNDILAIPDNHDGFRTTLSQGGDSIVGNRIYGNPFGGGMNIDMAAGAGGELIQGNKVFRNSEGLTVNGFGQIIVGNEVRDNHNGLSVGGLGGHLVEGNRLSSNSLGQGLTLTGAGNLVAGNLIFDNDQEGVLVGGLGNTFLGDVIYGNNFGGVGLANGAFKTLMAGVRLGYTAGGASSPDATAELFLASGGSNESAVLRDARINPSGGILPTGFNKAGNSLVSYAPAGAPGTVQVYGDFAPAAALTLDWAQRLQGSRATSPLLLRGGGHSLTGITTNDANAVSQAISVRYDGTNWRVEGSSTGFMGNYVVGGGAQGFPAATPQVTFTFTPGFSTAAGDRVSFGLLAATNDANTRKWLLFGDSAAAFNGGKSRLTLAPGIALTLTGTAAEPTMMDRLTGGSTYYTLIASGPVTMANVAAQNMDAQGFQLMGSGGVSLSSVTFDNIGLPGGAYITARDLTSTLTLYGMAFDDSGGKAPLSVDVQGTDAGLGWVMAGYSGVRSGDASDNDPNGRIYWSGSSPVGTPGSFIGVGVSDGIDLAWTAPNTPPAFYRGSYRLYSSTVAASGPFSLRTTLSSTSTFFNDPGLLPQTTYYYRLQASDANGVFGSSATAAALTGDFALPAVSSIATAEGRTAGVGWTSTMTVTFNKAMPLGSVQGAVTLRRLKDNLGNPVDEGWAVTVAAGGASNIFTAVSTGPLAGNSMYELAVTTAALDGLGQPLSSSATLHFTTFMDRRIHNIVTQGLGINGAVVDVPANALAGDGYLTGSALSSSDVDAATRKLLETTGDPLRVPLAGSLVSLGVFDSSGTAQPAVFASPLTLSLPYADDGNGNVAGTSPRARAGTLALYWLNQDGVWVRLPSSRDPAAGRVSARTAHFTTFALIPQADTDLSAAHPYPVPWTPRSGKADVTFTSVGDMPVIRIYTLSGALVRELKGPAQMGQVGWDLRNQQGEPVATGVYYYDVTNGKERAMGKLAVVR